MRMSKDIVFKGAIPEVRAVEDTIRATKKYTEGIGTIRIKHPVQGEAFHSRVFCKYYEVYPDIELSWDMPVGVALDWLWKETPCIDVTFKYDYRENRASVVIEDGTDAVFELERSVPKFRKTLAELSTNGTGKLSGTDRRKGK